jgi:hypothetical protein
LAAGFSSRRDVATAEAVALQAFLERNDRNSRARAFHDVAKAIERGHR